jgi:hypothetical protein
MATRHRRGFISLVVVTLCVVLCSGCGNELKYHNIYMAGAVGALVGVIVGHQSDEDAAGAAVGAALFATGEWLRQVDELNDKELKEAAEEVAREDRMLRSTRAGY